MLYLMLDQLQQNVLPLYPVGVSFAVPCEHCSLSFCTVPLREVWLSLLYRLLQDPLCAQLLLHNQSVSACTAGDHSAPNATQFLGFVEHHEVPEWDLKLLTTPLANILHLLPKPRTRPSLHVTIKVRPHTQ